MITNNEDKYTFETSSIRDMNLVVNRNDMFYALTKLSDWRRELWNNKDYDSQYLCNGKLYTQQDILMNNDLPRNEDGTFVDCKKVYVVEDIINKIDSILVDLSEFIYRNDV